MRIVSVTKKNGENVLVVLVELSLKIRVSAVLFGVTVSGLQDDQISFGVQQRETNLSQVQLIVTYTASLQGRTLSMSYSEARRLE